jgi:hypothetical protein
MAGRTNIHVDLGQRALGGEGIAAGAVHRASLITGMNAGFHNQNSQNVGLPRAKTQGG